MKKVVIVIFTCCLVLSLMIFLRPMDLNMVTELIQKTGYKFCLLLLTTFVAYIFGTLSWQYALGEYAKCISTFRLFLIRHVGETVGMFNPASVIGGDALKVMMLDKEEIPRKIVVWSMLFSRGIMVVSQLLLFSATTLALLVYDPSLRPQNLNDGKKFGLYPLIVASWKGIWLKFSDVFRELPVMLKANKRMLVFSCAFALLHWVFGGLEFYLILKFLGIKVTLVHALVVDLGVVLFKAAGAFVPGQLGIEEYGNKIMLMIIGVPAQEIWVTASVLRRARQLFWIAVAIGIYFVMFKKQRATVRS